MNIKTVVVRKSPNIAVVVSKDKFIISFLNILGVNVLPDVLSNTFRRNLVSKMKPLKKASRA